MPKLSDVFLHLLSSTLGAGGISPEKQQELKQEQMRNQQAADTARLTAFSQAGQNSDFQPPQASTQPVTAGMNGAETPTPQTPQGLPVPGMAGYTMTPKPIFDVVPQYGPDGKFTGGYTHIERPRGGKTTAYRPPSANAERLRQTPFTDEKSGMPLLLGSGGTLTPATMPGGGKAVPFKGDESAIGDANLIAQQTPNVDKLFDAYAAMKVPGQARAQSTGVGGLMDPAAKQLEDSLKLTAFTFGGKNLTGQEKEVVFGALFPNWKDNDASREQKRSLMKDFFAGKIDLLQAANLLGSAGGTLRAMLKQKAGDGKLLGQGNRKKTTGTPTLGSDPLGIL